jgi:hypothetical protein
VAVPEKSVVWHEGVRYGFRNGMWATPRGYVWPNTELCHELDAAHEAHVAAGKSYWEEDQQGVGIPQTIAGARQFAGNVEDRKAELKIQAPAKEGTPNTGATSPNESKVEERGLKPYAAAPFSSWGQVGYERRLMTLFTRATYDPQAIDQEVGKSESPKADEATDPKAEAEIDAIHAELKDAHASHLKSRLAKVNAKHDAMKHPYEPDRQWDLDVTKSEHELYNPTREAAADIRTRRKALRWGKEVHESESVDEAKRGRPRSQVGVRQAQGGRKRIRNADGKWQWASKNRI